MKIEQLRKELNHLLENVVEHSQGFSNGRSIPSLEISFVLAKITKMQESLIVLRYLLQEQERGFKKEKQRVQQNIKIEIKQNEAIETEPSVQNIVEVVSESIQELKAKVPMSLEKLPIPKLMDALSLNDRYLYANELFNKDMAAFNELVKSIDNSNVLNEAKVLISTIESELNWDEENTHVISFLTLVERRFLS